MTAATTAATALVIVESHFGNTRTIARAVAAGLADAGVRASVLDADRAGAPPADLDLLVVGAPTHNRGLSTAGSRAAAGGADGAGVRQAALAVLGGADGVEVDYVALVDPDSFVDLADAGLGLPAAPQVALAELGASTGQAGDEPGAGVGPETGDDPGREVSASAGRTALLALAARVGSTRLIDNALVVLH